MDEVDGFGIVVRFGEFDFFAVMFGCALFSFVMTGFIVLGVGMFVVSVIIVLGFGMFVVNMIIVLGFDMFVVSMIIARSLRACLFVFACFMRVGTLIFFAARSSLGSTNNCSTMRA